MIPTTLVTRETLYTMKRDGNVVLSNASYGECVRYIHRTHSYSMHHALVWEGYTISQTGERFS